MIDFEYFFSQVVVVGLLTRLQIINVVANDETFSARVFKAWSAKARLRIVATLTVAPVVDIT